MKRINLFLVALFLAIGLLAGCGDATDTDTTDNNDVETEQTDDTAESNEDDSFPVTITDGSGEDITIEKKPETIISLMPSNTEIAYALDLGDEIIAVSDNDTYPEEALEKEKVGGMELNVEKIISLKPELVLAESANDPDGIDQLRDAGLTVVVIGDSEDFDDVYEAILLVGKGTGETEKAEEVIQGMKDKLAEIEEKAEEISDDEMKSAFVEISPEPEIYTAGKGTFMDEFLSIIRAENVAGDEEGWFVLSEEEIIQKNPDVILVTYGYTDDPVGDVMNRKGWENVQALKDEQVIEVDEDIVSRPGPRLVEGVEEFAKAVYPEIFND